MKDQLAADCAETFRVENGTDDYLNFGGRVSLLSDLWSLWSNLAQPWRDYLSKAGLKDVSENTFGIDLQKTINVDFRLPGLEDLSRETVRGIEPGDPARSLLYHVLASPGVEMPSLSERQYPSLADIDLVENYIYSVAYKSLADLRTLSPNGKLAIAVFALEYCPAIETPHKRHADLCLSRTGLARIGTVRANYKPSARGFDPKAPKEHDLAVVPCRYAAFISAQVPGDPQSLGDEFQSGDEKRLFLMPLHKLFNGDECLAGITGLKLIWNSYHVNQKVRKVQEALDSEQLGMANVRGSALNEAPYTITEDLAYLDHALAGGSCLLTPVCHDPLVRPAERGSPVNAYATFIVPGGHDAFLSTLSFQPQPDDSRRWPEFVHIRHQLAQEPNGSMSLDECAVPLEAFYNITSHPARQAVHFEDFTAEGWVRADVEPRLLEECNSAYSIVAQPDFFPLVRQQELLEWWKTSAPEDIKDNIWPEGVEPGSLANTRLPANFNLLNSGFQPHDDTVTAVVTPLGISNVQQAQIQRYPVKRESILPFRASDLFEPGWDIGMDTTGGVKHLAAYGLGSPFAEDLMLCALEGSFWPAAVPDTARMFEPAVNPSVTPLLDEEIGAPGKEWDRVRRPTHLRQQKLIRFEAAAHVDYVQTVWKREMLFGRFMHITLEEYVARTLFLAEIYHHLGARTPAERGNWRIISFTKEFEPPSDLWFPEPRAQMYKIEIIRGASRARTEDCRFVDVSYDKLLTFYGGPGVLFEGGHRVWTL